MSSLDFDHDQNHEPNLKDNQDGMSNLELSSPDFPHEVGVVYPKSVLMTEKKNETLDSILAEYKDIF
jgi:hypothetical protein